MPITSTLTLTSASTFFGFRGLLRLSPFRALVVCAIKLNLNLRLFLRHPVPLVDHLAGGVVFDVCDSFGGCCADVEEPAVFRF